MDAAKYLTTLFHAVADDAALAMWTSRGEGVNRVFEAVKSVALPAHANFYYAALLMAALKGIGVDSNYVYLTGEKLTIGTENGVSGDTRLYIGQYQYLPAVDSSGIAPTASDR